MHQVTLHLGETTLTLTAGTAQLLLPIGISTLTQAFGHRMPNALALENAIANVEDAVMPAAQWLPAGVQAMKTRDHLLAQLIHSTTGNPNARSASREAVESLFSALARQSQQPGFHDLQLAQTPEASAALLILREAMHHWGMTEISIL
ncbi:hypothetical protein DZC30_15685 [Comamonas testosteroni]|uniref:Uncharacterized protein n=1 Tax=Comamonas testosteroni TaxID=285 RepID=A0A373FIP3_COMTE|nr:hypothetical protein [Comamonas testosteroni]RGE43259.1 hypothetical protein DZC30_15685 [Comamonas testosteroni]